MKPILDRTACWLLSALTLLTSSAWAQQIPDTVPNEQLPAPRAVAESTPGITLDDLMKMTVESNPRLAQATFAIDNARGRAVQAGLYPNPVLNYSADEIADRTGPVGIHTPLFSQEIVTAGKLKLSQAAAHREVDQATLALVAERYARFTAVRQRYFEVLTLQRRVNILQQVVKLAEQAVGTTKRLLDAKLVSRLDLIQLEVEQERFQAELAATQKELPPAWQRLAASVGVPHLPHAPLVGLLERPFPNYELQRASIYLVNTHPEIKSAHLGVDRAHLLLRRAQVEPIPNVTVGAGYVYQGQNRSNDVSVMLSLPLPVWNRNQGNIAAAQAAIGEASQRVTAVTNDLIGRLAEAYRAYAAAQQRADRYRATILPRAQEAYQLSFKAYKGGEFEYLRVIQAQRTMAEANLEYNRALGEAWVAASELSGLLLEEHWPPQSFSEKKPAPATP